MRFKDYKNYNDQMTAVMIDLFSDLTLIFRLLQESHQEEEKFSVKAIKLESNDKSLI